MTNIALGSGIKEISFWPAVCSVLLVLDETPPSILNPKVLQASRDHGPQLKEEFHVSVLNYELGRKFQNLSDEQKEELEEIANDIEWGINFQDAFHVLEKEYGEEKRCSIIQMVTLDGYSEFRERVVDRFEIDLPETIASHVTLCAYSTVKRKMLEGIGVTTKKDLEKISIENF
ncbi:MAG: hypothetical protein OEX08_02820 [Candidatus Nomurabacteria bacterium]|nr:hypothetical protein [Candidatus Nomurabacteria bacterium]